MIRIIPSSASAIVALLLTVTFATAQESGTAAEAKAMLAGACSRGTQI